jgi:hypothetical protein
MELNYLKQYTENCISLIRTLVIKSESTADLINEYITLQKGEGSVDLSNPITWKYYLNLSGNYHSTDELMFVTSLDSLDQILFSKENLTYHTSTRKAYEHGSRYYYSLINKYPNQERLVLGILYPSDIQTAIDAKDGSILSYSKSLVEFQERTLITDLEDYIIKYLNRWNLKAYQLTDNLFPACMLAILYMNLVPTVMNLRLKRCKTDEAHSFHIREYLASHQGLDKYLDFMTLKQTMYLYRNICYIEKHSGRTDQFLELVEKLLTDRRIPLTDYSVRQIPVFDSNHYPQIIVRKKPINPEVNNVETEYDTIAQMYLKEKSLEDGNIDYLDQHKDAITREFQNYNSNIVQTKILESDMVDYSGSVPDTYEDVLLREWVSNCELGLYHAVTIFKDPKTFDIRSLYVNEAFIYMQYVYNKAYGANVVTIPDYVYFKARKMVVPSIDDLLSVTDGKYHDVLRPIAKRILDEQSSSTLSPSISIFNDKAKKIYEESLYHWYLLSNTHDMELRGAIEQMILQLYYGKKISFSGGSMLNWLNARNLPLYDYTFDEAMVLVTNIFTAATGLIIDPNKKLSNIQKSMISIMKALSSYSIQFISNINQDKIIPINWDAIRFSTGDNRFENDIYVLDKIQTIDLNVLSDTFTDVTVDLTNRLGDYWQSGYTDTVFVKNGLETDILETRHMEFGVYHPTHSVEVEYPEYNVNISRNSKFIGEEFLVSLPQSSLDRIKTIY